MYFLDLNAQNDGKIRVDTANDDILITKPIWKQTLQEISPWLIVRRKSDLPQLKSRQKHVTLCPFLSHCLLILTLHPTKSREESEYLYL